MVPNLSQREPTRLHKGDGGIHHGQFTSPSQGKLLPPMGNLVTNKPTNQVFGVLEAAGENPNSTKKHPVGIYRNGGIQTSNASNSPRWSDIEHEEDQDHHEGHGSPLGGSCLQDCVLQEEGRNA